MSVAITDAIGAILDHYGDVIEGGNSYNSGTSYRGVPGTKSIQQWVAAGGSVTASANGTTTTIVASGVAGATAQILTRVDGPPFFMRCDTATNATNVGAARKIASHSVTTFGVAAFPAATTASDTFTVLEGFKRTPDDVDIFEDGSEAAYDRYIDLDVELGGKLDWSGDGTQTYQAMLTVALRICKHSRTVFARKSAMENLTILRSVLCRGANPDHRESNYVRAIATPEGSPEVVVDDRVKIVLQDNYPLILRVHRDFL